MVYAPYATGCSGGGMSREMRHVGASQRDRLRFTLHKATCGDELHNADQRYSYFVNVLLGE